MDNFVIFLPLFNQLLTCPLVSQHWTPKTQLAFLHNAHWNLGKTHSVSIPSKIAPNIWILTTPSSAGTTAVTLICPGETSKSITIKKPFHILWLPPACNAISPNFHLSPHYENSALEVNITLDMTNLNMINMPSLDFHIWQHLEKHQNES